MKLGGFQLSRIFYSGGNMSEKNTWSYNLLIQLS